MELVSAPSHGLEEVKEPLQEEKIALFPEKKEKEQPEKKILKADILLKSGEEEELVKNLQLKLTKSEGIQAKPLMQKLQTKGFEMEECRISYFSEKEQMFVFLGRHPLKEESEIPISELER